MNIIKYIQLLRYFDDSTDTQLITQSHIIFSTEEKITIDFI